MYVVFQANIFPKVTFFQCNQHFSIQIVFRCVCVNKSEIDYVGICDVCGVCVCARTHIELCVRHYFYVHI
jgi:hypothetical protein